jgi:DNA-binding NarL/FixJ family response regulator
MDTNSAPTILIADDQAMMRDGIVLMIQTAWPNSICKIASDYQGVIEQLERQTNDALFNVIILDLRMPGMRGVESVNHIAKLAAGIPVIVCTALEDPSLTERLMSCGIYRAVNKTTGADELLRQVRAALLLPKTSMLDKTAHLAPTRPGNQQAQSGSAMLTVRQREILKMLHTGKPSKVIATQLGIGLGTIKSHLHTLYSVMGVNSRSEAIVKSQNWLL